MIKVFIKKTRVDGCTDWLCDQGLILHWDIKGLIDIDNPDCKYVYWEMKLKDEPHGITFIFPASQKDKATIFRLTFA